MRRIICILAAAIMGCLAIISAVAEDVPAPKFIEAKEGTLTAMQISSLDDGKVVGIIGVESEPMPCTWKDFCAAMNEQFEDVPFTPAYWSDSRWVHLVSTYDLVIRIYTTDATDDGLVQSILVNTPYADGAEDVQIVTACAFHAVAQPGTYGSYAVSIALEEEHSDDWFTEQPIQIWMENGYAFSFCQTDNFGLPCGMVEYLEQMQVSGGYLPLEDEYYYLPDGISTSDLIDELSAQANSGPLASWLSAPVLPDKYDTDEDGRIYSVEWDDCLVVLYTDAIGENVQVVNIVSLSGDTKSMCMHLYPLYIAVTRGQTEDLMLISDFVGGNGTWDDMSKLEPYCVMNGVQLQCSLFHMDDGRALPWADICGAEER